MEFKERQELLMATRDARVRVFKSQMQDPDAQVRATEDLEVAAADWQLGRIVELVKGKLRALEEEVDRNTSLQTSMGLQANATFLVAFSEGLAQRRDLLQKLIAELERL